MDLKIYTMRLFFLQSIGAKLRLVILFVMLLRSDLLFGQQQFPWPEGKTFAISLSFDDSRPTNLEYGIPILDSYGIRATFYVHPDVVKNNLEGWKSVLSSGHEIGNHSLLHPCSGNFLWARNKSLEEYTLASMEEELSETSRQLYELLGVTPQSFAYPCGQTVVGRGEGKKSYVPVVAKLFTSGRGWLDEAPIDPFYVDLSEISGVKMDDMDLEELMPMITYARENGLWLALAGHDTQPEHTGQTTRLDFLGALGEYLAAHEEIWVAPVGEVASYITSTRTDGRVIQRDPLPVRAGLDGEINLKASLGQGRGPEIEYMADWKAFGWWTSNDSAVWTIDVAEAGVYQVEMEWSVSDEEAGKAIKLIVDGEECTVTIGKSGSWETFKTATVGTIKVSEGKHRFMIVPADPNLNGHLMDVRTVRLIPIDIKKNQLPIE